jgi:hypothetical protein
MAWSSAPPLPSSSSSPVLSVFDGVEDWLSNHPAFAPAVSITVVTFLIASVCTLYIRQRWRSYFDAACKAAFAEVDIDHSGSIDKNELYVGVLELYLQLHRYGLNIRTPPRDKVEKLMDLADTDGRGLELEKFKEVIEPLVRQTFGRVILQIALTIICPMMASYVTFGMRFCVVTLMEFGHLSTPSLLKALGATLPAALDETLLTTLLLLVIGPALSLCDDHVVKVTQKKIHKQTTSTRDQPADPADARPSKADSNPIAFVDDLGKGVVDVIDGLGKNIQELGRTVHLLPKSAGAKPKPEGVKKSD